MRTIRTVGLTRTDDRDLLDLPHWVFLYWYIYFISTSHMEVLLSVWTIIDGFPYLSCWFRIDIYMQLFHLPACTLSFFRFSQHACKYYGQLHCLLELIMHHVIQANDKFLVTHHFDKHYDFKFTSVSDLILNILPSIP